MSLFHLLKLIPLDRKRKLNEIDDNDKDERREDERQSPILNMNVNVSHTELESKNVLHF